MIFESFIPNFKCPIAVAGESELMFANTKVYRVARILKTSWYILNLWNVYEAEDYHEDFYILNNISFGLVSNLNDVINTFIVLHYRKWSNECTFFNKCPSKRKIFKISTPL